MGASSFLDPMSKKTFIGIVSNQGSRESEWNGVFDYDDVTGYTGSILSTSHQPEIGKDIFAIPKELDNELLYCVIDGSKFGTIVWPELRDVEIKDFVAQIRGLRIKNLIKGIHIGGGEHDVTQLQIESPILAQLFQLRAFQQKMEMSPYKITIESDGQKDTEFISALGSVFIGISGSHSPSGKNAVPVLETKSYLNLHANPPITPIDAIKIVKQIEHLLSLLTFDFVKATRL
jgi:hypothetical protein